jgi:TetR/AcrR family transcriptional regulator, transcriptional repressor of aconitase
MAFTRRTRMSGTSARRSSLIAPPSTLCRAFWQYVETVMISRSAFSVGSDSVIGGRGRPSQVAARAEQLVSTFLDLVAANGLEATSLNEVAEASGISRSAIRHFVGNRESLIAAAITHLCDSYLTAIRDAVGEEPKPEELIRFLFSPIWTDPFAVRTRAFDALLSEGSYDSALSMRMRGAYEELIALLVTSFRRLCLRGPTEDQYVAAAYSIVCLSESHASMRAIGFDESYARFAFDSALALMGGLVDLP